VCGLSGVGWGLWGLIMARPVGAASAFRHAFAVLAGYLAVVAGGF
jgi:hypothetical protein